jgi:hypothetical protein
MLLALALTCVSAFNGNHSQKHYGEDMVASPIRGGERPLRAALPLLHDL